MAEKEIINKLNIFLKSHLLFKEECEVVYLMVEVRKILQHKNNGKYSLLRFYCDWTVHARKYRITEEMKKIMTEVYENIKKEIETKRFVQGNEVIKFIYFEQLRKEMTDLFDEIKLSDDLVKKNELWLSFLKLFVKILENQPIIGPISEIKTFCFIPSNEGAVAGEVVFKNKILGKDKKYYDYFRFANVY